MAGQKGLELILKPKEDMYIEDVADFACLLLTTTEMAFICGWQRIQILFFVQLAAITALQRELRKQLENAGAKILEKRR